MIADKLGLGEKYRDGKKPRRTGSASGPPGSGRRPTDYDTFKQSGVRDLDKPHIAADLGRPENPLPTPSGKIGIFSIAKWE